MHVFKTLIQSSVELGKRASHCCTQLYLRLLSFFIFVNMGIKHFLIKKITNEVYFSCMDWSATCVSSLVVAVYRLKERKWTKDKFFFLRESSILRIFIPVVCCKYPLHPFPLSSFSFDWLHCLSLDFSTFFWCFPV